MFLKGRVLMARLFKNKKSYRMKRLFILFAAFAVLVSCGPRYSGSNGEKTQKDAEAEFLASLTQSDQDAVLALADEFMDKLKAGQVEDALDMIYVLYNDVLYKKSEAYTSDLVKRFKMFPVVEYERLYSSFSTEGNNDISYAYSFKKGSDGNPSQTMKLMLNPVLADGQWYLTFKDGTQSSKDLPKEKQIHELAPAPNTPRVFKPSE